MGLTCHFAMLDPNVKIPPLVRAMHFGEDPCYRWNAAYRDWIWTKQYLMILEPENTRKHILAPNDIPYSAVVHVAIAFRFWMERNSAKGKHIVPMQ